MPGLSSPLIVFSHANGFPAGTYRLLFETWRAAGFRVAAVERFGHDPAHPVTSNWPHLRDELTRFIELQGEPAHLVGHSLGGYLSLLAACRRPELVRSLVLLDAPLVGGWRATSLRLLKATGLMRRGGPGRVSKTRRMRWPSAEAAFQHFAAKPVFARWDERVLRDYIGCGTEPDPDPDGNSDSDPDSDPDGDSVRLAFSREVETHIYNTLPHHLDTLLKRHPPRCRVSFVGGTRSAEVRGAGLASTRRLVHERFEWIAGGHLFPMERPDEAAAAVLRALG